MTKTATKGEGNKSNVGQEHAVCFLRETAFFLFLLLWKSRATQDHLAGSTMKLYHKPHFKIRPTMSLS
jgi:hypothetical protein